ncbi:MAG: hypothetical protein RMJ36_01540 [Candidatus Calescibacterium sp.]|nr:hypothetical protein [Candidatus Calescibacterium sp.]MDW8132323.1 hypothetical protein [Candidatus Calescibacterium sp.]
MDIKNKKDRPFSPAPIEQKPEKEKNEKTQSQKQIKNINTILNAPHKMPFSPFPIEDKFVPNDKK